MEIYINEMKSFVNDRRVIEDHQISESFNRNVIDPLEKLTKEVIKYCIKNDLSLRDCIGKMQDNLDVQFSEAMLIVGMNMRRGKRGQSPIWRGIK